MFLSSPVTILSGSREIDRFVSISIHLIFYGFRLFMLHNDNLRLNPMIFVFHQVIKESLLFGFIPWRAKIVFTRINASLKGEICVYTYPRLAIFDDQFITASQRW